MINKLTKGGPGNEFLGDGKIDTSKWFESFPVIENQIKNEDIWFCTAPFQMMYTSVSGELLPCSWAKEKIGPNVEHQSITKYFFKDDMLKDLRTEMLTPGSDLKLAKEVCKNCIYQEEHYGRSRRQASLKIQSNDKILWPRIRNLVEDFKANGTIELKERMLEVQVKAFGNKCNLDCYMCIPYDSSTRIQTINSAELKGEKIFSRHSKKKPREQTNDTIDNIIDEIVSVAPYIYNLKLIGGEPLVMKKFYTLLERLVESGESKNMIVKYQTNMSTLEFDKIKISKLIPYFDIFEFTVSLDSIGKTGDYIRRRSSWEEIQNNIRHVKQYPNVEVNINGTISFLSVLRFWEMIDWFNDNHDLFNQINWSNIRGPAKLCANVLPKELKEKMIPFYEGFSDIQNILREDNIGASTDVSYAGKTLNYQDTLDYLLMIDKRYEGTKWEMNLFEVFPELEEYHTPKDSGLDIINT
jgi:MoaA/NifB/PqqE/SkfB family radical SAM enzyme